MYAEMIKLLEVQYFDCLTQQPTFDREYALKQLVDAKFIQHRWNGWQLTKKGRSCLEKLLGVDKED